MRREKGDTEVRKPVKGVREADKGGDMEESVSEEEEGWRVGGERWIEVQILVSEDVQVHVSEDFMRRKISPYFTLEWIGHDILIYFWDILGLFNEVLEFSLFVFFASIWKLCLNWRNFIVLNISTNRYLFSNRNKIISWADLYSSNDKYKLSNII